jgi:pimeloyl-ACP methyl ester carboxylesterase
MAKFPFVAGRVLSDHASSLNPSTLSVHRRQSQRRLRFVASTAAFCLSLLVLLSSQVHVDRVISAFPWVNPNKDCSPVSNAQDFQWRNLEPSQSLEYAPCFGPFHCARLSVPLNWNTTKAERENGPHAAVAIIKLPAKVPVTDPRYAGPVILNPGGPGESGINQVITDGENIQTILDSPVKPTNEYSNSTGEKYFDVLSFDPRGVNNTTPGLRCFPNAFNQKSWLLTYPDYGLLWDSESVIGMEWARAAALGASCSQEEEGKEVLPYVNTPQVVEDIVEIIEREGEWRANKAKSLISVEGRIDSPIARAVLERTAYHAGQEKLQYWGMSFGTIIGSTFSAMHPDRVGRIVIDGVVDPMDHYSGAWLTQLQNSDSIITELSRNCFQAGPEKCSLHTGSSAADVERRFTLVMESMKANPLPIVLPAVNASIGRTVLGPEIITYGDLHLYLLSGMYFPFAMAGELFNLVYALESRNTTSPKLAAIAASKQAIPNLDECQEVDPLSDQCIPYVSMMGSFQSISCMDSGGGPSSLTRKDFGEYLAKLRAQSRWISPSWARNKLVCLGNPVSPAWKIDFDFATQQWDNISHPMLIIGNTHDPVTPIGNAKRISTLFPGSVVLQQDSQGHCSHSNPSLCTGKVVREYFQTGNLPREGTVCEPESRPFIGCSKKDGCQLASRDDKTLWEAMVGLADPFGLVQKMGFTRKTRALQRFMFIS